MLLDDESSRLAADGKADADVAIVRLDFGNHSAKGCASGRNKGAAAAKG